MTLNVAQQESLSTLCTLARTQLCILDDPLIRSDIACKPRQSDSASFLLGDVLRLVAGMILDSSVDRL